MARKRKKRKEEGEVRLVRETIVELMRAADELRRRFSRVVEPQGITFQQYNVLRILRGAGPEGLPTLEVAERMTEQTPGITRLVDRLEAKGLVLRRRVDRDRRQVLCCLTPRGAELLEKMDRPMDEADRQALAGLKRKELELLKSWLGRLSRR